MEKKYGRKMSLWLLMVFAFIAFLPVLVIAPLVGTVLVGITGHFITGMDNVQLVMIHVAQWGQTFFVMMLVPYVWMKRIELPNKNNDKVTAGQVFSALHLDNIDWRFMFLTLCLFVVSIPFYAFIEVGILKDFPMPDALRTYLVNEMQNSVQMMQMILTPSGFWGWLELILLMCVGTAIGEEMMFRGALLKWFDRNPRSSIHTKAILVGFIFAAIHGELVGIPSRWLMGTLFVYMVYWSGSLWVPILAHCLNNLFALVQYKMTPADELLELEYGFDAIITILSFIISALLLWLMWRLYTEKAPGLADSTQQTEENA